MKRSLIAILALVLVAAGSAALAQSFSKLRASMGPLNEVPSVSSTASGAFSARISEDESTVDWELSYADLEGNVTQAHIHLGDHDTNGGISVFLCTNLGNGPAGTQACPPPPATITGTFSAGDIVGPAAQGLTTGELAELIAAIRAGKTYANVHSTKFPGGEARGQISASPAAHKGD